MIAENILITGASGLIGSRLTHLLLQRGHQVSHLGRQAKSGKVPSYVWDLANGKLDTDALNGIDTIIHLAGAGIADKRWSAKRKDEILSSRVDSTKLLHATLAKGNHQVKNFISASAVGFYGFALGTEIFTEETKPGTDYLASVTKAWEDEVDKIAVLPIRIAKLRIGIVLSKEGGALKSMLLPIKLGVGSPLGTGKQGISWIHIDDLCRMFIHLVVNKQLSGAFNGTGKYTVDNAELTKQIARVISRPLFLPNVPSFVLKIILGEMADMVVRGSYVSSEKIQATGFTFQYPELLGALKNLLTER